MPDFVLPPPDGDSTHPPEDALPKVAGVAIEGEIARGSYAIVYLGTRVDNGQQVAVKVLAPVPGRDMTTSLSRFKREIRALSELSHPLIVAFQDARETEDGRPCILMDYVKGQTLRQRIETHGSMSEAAGIALMCQLAEALGAATKLGIIHRDVKPENIILKPVTEGGLTVDFPFVAMLTDLGLARFEESGGSTAEAAITLRGAIIGTPSVMAPEQFREASDADHRTDIYALGCVVFFALAGKHAFAKGSVPAIVLQKVQGPFPRLREVVPDVSPNVDEFLARTMAAEREARVQTYAEIGDFCARYAAGEREAPPPPLKRTSSSREAVATFFMGAPAAPASPAEPEKESAAAPQTIPEVARKAGCMGVLLAAIGLGIAGWIVI